MCWPFPACRGGFDPAGATDWSEITAWATIALALATAVLACAAWRALSQVGELKRSRHAQTAADFSRRWDMPDLIKSRQMTRKYEPLPLRDAYLAALNDVDSDEVLWLLREPNYFEDLAILARPDIGAIDYEFVKRSLGDIIVRRWVYWEPTVNKIRELNEGRDNYPHFRALAVVPR